MGSYHTLPGDIEVRYIPDSYSAQEQAEGATWELGAGTISVGIPVGDGFLELANRKAGTYFDEQGLARLKKEAESAGEQDSQSAPEGQSQPTPPEA